MSYLSFHFGRMRITTTRYSLTPSRILRSEGTTFRRRSRREDSCGHGWWEHKLAQLFGRAVGQYLVKLCLYVTYALAIPLLNICPREILPRVQLSSKIFSKALLAVYYKNNTKHKSKKNKVR